MLESLPIFLHVFFLTREVQVVILGLEKQPTGEGAQAPSILWLCPVWPRSQDLSWWHLYSRQQYREADREESKVPGSYHVVLPLHYTELSPMFTPTARTIGKHGLYFGQPEVLPQILLLLKKD